MVNTGIRSGKKEIDAYIESLEGEILSFRGQKVKLLIRSIDNIAGKLSKDLDLIAAEENNPDGTEVELSNKIVDTFLKMIEKAEKIKNFSDVVSALDKIPEEVKVTTTTTVTEEVTQSKVTENPFEKMTRKVKENG